MVIDASAAVLGLLSDGAARAMMAIESLHTPHLADSEVVQAIRSQVLRGSLPAADAQQAIDTWARVGIRRYPVTGLLGRVWELRENLSAYDASYVALAEALDCVLVSADARLASASRLTCAVTVVRS